MRTFKITNNDLYVYYRLLVKKTASASATSVMLGELQLHGLCVSNQDLTSREGTTSCYVPGVNGGETVDKLFDKAAASKYCFSFYGESWVDYQAAEGMKANLYSLTSANDNADRDPQSWKVLGSHDGSHWVVLDERNDELFYDRHITQFYSFDNSEPYAYYRLQLDENKGSELCQISEFQLFYSDAIATGVNSIQEPYLALNVYPNPVIDYLHVDLPAEGRIQVFDSQGLLMAQLRAQKGNNQVDFASVAPGLYLVKVVCGAQKKTFKVVK
ncbi:MAG: T9SS type A sorting domain-containing protein [Hoylesella buccalis]